MATSWSPVLLLKVKRSNVKVGMSLHFSECQSPQLSVKIGRNRQILRHVVLPALAHGFIVLFLLSSLSVPVQLIACKDVSEVTYYHLLEVDLRTVS